MRFETIDDLSDPHLQRMRFVQPKLDGNNIVAVKDKFGDVKVFTRQKKEITESIRHCDFYRVLQVYFRGPINITGELWRNNLPCSSIPTALKGKEDVDFRAFHVEGIEDYEYSRLFCEERNLPFIPFKTGPFTSLQLHELWDHWKELFSPADGLVFSNGPNAEMIKWKEKKTIDLVLTNWKRGKVGKYYNTIGKLVCQTAEGFEVAHCSGMSDTERRYIHENWKTCYGRVIEVKYNSVGEKGRLRHPRFVRFRDDKDPIDCTLGQDKELELKWQVLSTAS